MSGFPRDWLALREPYDLRARNRDGARRGRSRRLPDRRPIAVVDLACGTGSTLRAIGAAPAAATELAAGRQRSQPAGARRDARRAAGRVTVTTHADRSRARSRAALDGPLDLVTTSALLDLVSADWLERLAVESAARRLPVYAALSYDGRVVA